MSFTNFVPTTYQTVTHHRMGLIMESRSRDCFFRRHPINHCKYWLLLVGFGDGGRLVTFPGRRGWARGRGHTESIVRKTRPRLHNLDLRRSARFKFTYVRHWIRKYEHHNQSSTFAGEKEFQYWRGCTPRYIRLQETRGRKSSSIVNHSSIKVEVFVGNNIKKIPWFFGGKLE